MKLKQRIVLGYLSTKLKVLERISIDRAAHAAFTLVCTPHTRQRTYIPPPEFAVAERLSFSFEGLQTTGFKWTPPQSNGRTILICHGFDSASYKFARYIQPLTDRGFQVIAFDAPAHGLSEGKTINVLMYRNYILQVIQQFGPVDALVGHSFGGIAAALAAEQLPPGNIHRLVLIAPATETWRSISDFCTMLQVSPRLANALDELIVSIAGHPVKWFSVARVVRHLHIPTLWLHDKADSITPFADVEPLLQLPLPHLQIVTTNGLGHSLYRDDAVARHIIEFLAAIEN